MKTIIYFLLISMLAIPLISSVQKSSENEKTIILRASEKNISEATLQKSSGIIKARLKTYGLTTPEVSVIPGKGEIKILVPEGTELKEIEGLLTSKGDLGFYETSIPEGLKDFLKNDQRFNPNEARLGCAASENTDMSEKVMEYLKINKLSSNVKLVWGIPDNKSRICLYGLKTNSGKSLMGRNDVETFTATRDKNSQFYLIQIKLRPASAAIWEKATRENMNKPIAIVIDDKVYFDPVVRSVISNGLCEISGTLTQQEVNYLLALVNNEQLPVSLSIIK